MTVNNENKKLPRNRKRRIEQRMKVDDKRKSFLKKIKTENKKINKNNDKIKELEIEWAKIKYVKNPNKLKAEPKELNKIQIVNKNLHEIKNEVLREYAGDFEMVGRINIADQNRETHIRFRKKDDFESYINAIEQD